MSEAVLAFTGKGVIRGYLFTQVKISEKAVIWDVNDNGFRYFEVWKRRFNGRFAVESKPGPKAFGKWAWTYLRLEDAQKRFNSI